MCTVDTTIYCINRLGPFMSVGLFFDLSCFKKPYVFIDCFDIFFLCLTGGKRESPGLCDDFVVFLV